MSNTSVASRTAGITVKFETTGCGRCAGSGMFGPLSINGGRCFTCGGSGAVLSRSGKAARKRFDAITEKMTKKVDDVQPGDIVRLDLSRGVTRSARAWVEVTNIGEANGAYMISTENGIETKIPFIKIEFAAEARLDGWTAPLTQSHFSIKVWDQAIYREAAQSVARLKGATVTGL